MNKVAIVISNDHYNALGVVRSLGCSKIYVILILFSEGLTYVDKSKYVNEAIKVSGFDEVSAHICKISCRFQNCFIFPLSDSSAEYIDRNYSSFPQNVYAPHMFGRMPFYQNKWNAKQLAQKIGMNVAIDCIENPKESDKSLWNIFPCIIKPLVSLNGRKSDIQTVWSSAAYSTALKCFEKKKYENVLVEQFLCGKSEYMIEVVGASTSTEVFIAGIIRKIREYPIINGSTSYAWVEMKSSVIDIELVKKYILETHYIGLFDMEFKYVDGKVYFIECNFRNGAPSYIFTRLNVNIPVAWINAMSSPLYNFCNRNEYSKCYFMCEQTDIMNMLKRKIGAFPWIRDFFRAKKIFVSIADLKPLVSYIFLMVSIFFEKLRNR